MSQQRVDFLEKVGLVNPRPDRITGSVLMGNPFFEPRDLAQVRYEMLRAARVGGVTVREACRQFGFSREYFYLQERAFMEKGLGGLLGVSRGRTLLFHHRNNGEILNFLLQRKLGEPGLTGGDLCREVISALGVSPAPQAVDALVEKLDAEPGAAATDCVR